MPRSLRFMPEKHVSCHTTDIDNEKDPLHTERVFSRYALITWRNAVSLGQSLVHDKLINNCREDLAANYILIWINIKWLQRPAQCTIVFIIS